jgi:hypothetical protein
MQYSADDDWFSQWRWSFSAYHWLETTEAYPETCLSGILYQFHEKLRRSELKAAHSTVGKYIAFMHRK